MASALLRSKIAVLVQGIALCVVTATTKAVDAIDKTQYQLGREVFSKQAQPSCGLCHTLLDAGASGSIGPNLDEIELSPERVITAVRSGVGVMPSFAKVLSNDQIEAVAHYVSRVTEK
jgi:mono/diheme cytochrome c family protein